MKDKKLVKDFVWNVIGTALNSFNSLFFLIVITRINGLNDGGIFSFAFSFACMMYFVGIYYGRVYQVTDKKGITKNEFVLSKILTCSLMMIFSIAFVIVKQYELKKSLIIILLCNFRMLEAFSEVFYGFMQKDNYLYKTGISLTIKSIISLIIFCVCDYLTKDIIFSLIIINVINIVIILIYDIKNSKIKFKFNYNKENVKLIFKEGIFPFLISFSSLYIINSPKFVIDNLLVNDVQAIFGIIIMPATILSLFAQFITYPFLLKIQKDFRSANKILLYMLIAILIFGIITTGLLYIVGIDILQIIYKVELLEYTNVFVFIMIGAIFNANIYVVSNILICMRSLKSQTIIYLLMTIISTSIVFCFVSKSGILGASLSYMLIMILLYILLLINYYIINKSLERKNEYSVYS